MRTAVLAVTVTVAGVILVLIFRSHSLDVVADSTPSLSPPPSLSRPASHTSSAPVSTSSSAPGLHLPSGHHVVTGPSVKTDYGAVQVQVTVDHARITEVRAVKLPHGNQLDIQLSAMADRKLSAAAIAGQTGDLDMVSQATVTSGGYVQSLQAALDQLQR